MQSIHHSVLYIILLVVNSWNYAYEFHNNTSIQVDPYLKEPKKRVLFEQLEQLINAQEESITTIRASEQEVCQQELCLINTIIMHHVCLTLLQTQAILDARIREEVHISLSISVYDVARNETARTHRKEQEAKMAEEERIRKEKEMDYLAPFLARIGDPPKLTKKQTEEVTQVSSCCLSHGYMH